MKFLGSLVCRLESWSNTIVGMAVLLALFTSLVLFIVWIQGAGNEQVFRDWVLGITTKTK